MEPVIQVDENTLPSEERLRLAVDGAQLGLWDGDIASGALYWNDHCYRHFGVPVGEAMTHDRFLSLLEPADREQVELAWRQAATSREDFQLDYPMTWPDGSRHWIRAVGRVYCDDAGQPARASGITLDITRKKAAEAGIQALNAGLEARIQARTAELEAEIAARRQLEDELRALNDTLERRVAERTAEILAAQAALGESELRYRTIVDNVADAIFVLDLVGNFLAVNDHACRQYGYRRDEFLRLHITAIDTPEDAVHAPARLAAVDRDGHATFEARHQDAQGHPLTVEIRSSKILYNGQPAMLSVVRDVTERQRAEALLRESEERFRRLFQDTRQPLSLVEDGHFIATNPATLAMLRLESPEQLLGRTPGDFSPPCQPDGQASAAKAAAMMRIAHEEGAHEFEWEHVRADGERFPAIILLTAISERHQTQLHVVWRDITAQKRAQARAEYLAYYDPLTGLPNRMLGLDRLTQKLAQAQRHQRSLALLYLDLDRFKHINDRYGHLLGDRLLQQFAQRLSRRLRAEDSLCRLAADEFMLVLPEVRNQQSLTDLARLCERLIALGREPYDLDGHQVYVDLSIGVALYPRDGADGETLMRHAGIALQAAKRAGRKTYRFYEPGMNAALTRFLQTREALRDALECEEFVLHYQPQIDLRTGRLVGVEALVRWQRPEVGLVMPGAFIDVAEESGLIVPLGRWVLVEACRQAAAWRASGWPDLVVAVNISAAQFRHARIGAEVLAVLAATGLAPAGLEVELTESILLEGREAALATVAQWQARGIQLAIDDFGTGYSSLAYLKRFAADKIKIDRSFIVGMAEDDADRAIVQAIIDLAGGLKLRTIAEGVEEASLARQLQLMGCDEAQGYLYAPPLAVAELEGWLRAREVSSVVCCKAC